MEQINSTREKSKWYEYAILLFLILWSGGGFTYGLFPEWMLYMMFIVGFEFFKRGYKLSTASVLFVGVVLSVHFMQMFLYNGDIISIIKPACILLLCAMFARMISSKFMRTYVDILYVLSLISLVLWLICQSSAGLSFLRSVASMFPLLGWDNIENNSNAVTTLYVFSIPLDCEGLIRNSGAFWEPGRFTIYITLALAINLFYFREKITSRRNLVFIFTNVTTFSTTGYAAMAMLFIGYIFFSNIKVGYKLLYSFLLLLVVNYVWQLDFIGDKITEQVSDDSTWSRFGAIAYHWGQIKQSPMLGFGPYLPSVFGKELFSSPNGLTDLFRYYGIPLSLVFYYYLYEGTKLYIGHKLGINIVVFITILILCFSQTITYSPFFMLLYFLPFSKTN